MGEEIIESWGKNQPDVQCYGNTYVCVPLSENEATWTSEKHAVWILVIFGYSKCLITNASLTFYSWAHIDGYRYVESPNAKFIYHVNAYKIWWCKNERGSDKERVRERNSCKRGE